MCFLKDGTAFYNSVIKNKLKMKKNILFLLLTLSPFFIFGQDEIQTIVKEGIVLHDAQKYDEALKKYNVVDADCGKHVGRK